MKKLFKKAKQLEHKHLRELALMCGCMTLLLLVAMFIGSGVPKIAYAWTIYPNVYSTPNPVTTGGYISLFWQTGTGQADYCYIREGGILGGPGASGHPTVPGSTCNQRFGVTSCLSGRYNGTGNSQNNIGPINSSITYAIDCYNDSGGIGSSAGYGSTNWTVTPRQPDNCSAAATPTSNGFLVAPGVRNIKGTINGTAYNFCVNNQTLSTYFIPLKTPAEYNSFVTAANGRLASYISYFSRNPGY